MPVIGHDVRLPTNRDLQQIIVDIMEKDGISLNNFQNQSNVAATSASGSYRRIVVTPSQVQYDIVEMQNENEDLLTPHYLSEPDPTPTIVRSTDEVKAPRIWKALRLRFNL